MKLLHLADLHLGKNIHGYSLMDNGDQPHWVEQLLCIVERERPDVILIAGDVYDRSAPSNEAVALLDELLTRLTAEKSIPVLMIAGNHDSGRRLSFGSRLLSRQKLHIAGVSRRTLDCVTLEDEHGSVNFYLMPYLFASQVARLLEDDSIRDTESAVKALLDEQNIDFSQRNVLIAHQNVTDHGCEAQRGGSESMVGGVGGVDYRAFDGFDYVALGHIHSNYPVGRSSVRYAGTPICYHFEETRQQRKGPLLVTLGAKGEEPQVRVCSIQPLHPMREVRGTLAEILEQERKEERRGEYIRVLLEEDVIAPDTVETLRTFFAGRDSLLMEFVAQRNPFLPKEGLELGKKQEKQSEEALFYDFYTERTGGEQLDEQQRDLLTFVGELVRGSSDEERPTEPPEEEVDRLVNFLLSQEVEP